ncbi:MAG: Glutamate--tRNA ligase [Planctomycetota bacterium]|jgi:glutamyl-tRNA synthetase
MTVRTRFAPSPTGYLHIGGVRTALYNWLLAKQAGGQFLLRIDDTDQQRNVEEALQPILEGFRWLGLNWDEGPEIGGPYAPYFQSQRSSRYQAAVDTLIASGHAYRDFAKTEELQAQREQAEKEGRPFVYDRQWMAVNDQQARLWAAEGRTSVVRLKMPREGKCQFNDLIRGDVEFDWSAEQDHVIQRADGTFLYHLASVVDDFDFKITHVVRAVEHLPNTPRQIFIAQSLKYPLPIFAHLPYVAEPGGTSKLSKRKLDKYLKQNDFKSLYEQGRSIAEQTNLPISPETFNPVVIDFYRQIGFLPESILNYLLLVGWSLDDSTEDFTLDDMVRLFSLDRVNRAPASFDPQKLVAFQARWMQRLDIKKKVAMVLPYLQKTGWVSTPPPCSIAEKIERVVRAAGERLKVAGDILQYDEFFLPDDKISYSEADVQKRITSVPDATVWLADLSSRFQSANPQNATEFEHCFKAYLDEKQLKIGQVINALRVAITGKGLGVGVFDALDILGTQAACKRIEQVRQK